MVSALGVARHLGAKYAVGHGVVRVALHFGGHTVLHAGDQRAGVRAVVRAGAQDGGGVHVGIVQFIRLIDLKYIYLFNIFK
jgi:hypothetical protein